MSSPRGPPRRPGGPWTRTALRNAMSKSSPCRMYSFLKRFHFERAPWSMCLLPSTKPFSHLKIKRAVPATTETGAVHPGRKPPRRARSPSETAGCMRESPCLCCSPKHPRALPAYRCCFQQNRQTNSVPFQPRDHQKPSLTRAYKDLRHNLRS